MEPITATLGGRRCCIIQVFVLRKSTLMLSFSFEILLRYIPRRENANIHKEEAKRIEPNWIPHGEKFKINPKIGIRAKDKPMAKAMRSVPSRSFFLGNNDSTRAYPGKRSIKNNPRMILRKFDGSQ